MFAAESRGARLCQTRVCVCIRNHVSDTRVYIRIYTRVCVHIALTVVRKSSVFLPDIGQTGVPVPVCASVCACVCICLRLCARLTSATYDDDGWCMSCAWHGLAEEEVWLI